MGGVGDEVAPGPRDALEAAYGADGQAAEDLDKEVVCKNGRRIPLSRGRLHLVEGWRQIPAPPSPAVRSQLCTSNTMTCEENETAFLLQKLVHGERLALPLDPLKRGRR